MDLLRRADPVCSGMRKKLGNSLFTEASSEIASSSAATSTSREAGATLSSVSPPSLTPGLLESILLLRTNLSVPVDEFFTVDVRGQKALVEEIMSVSTGGGRGASAPAMLK